LGIVGFDSRDIDSEMMGKPRAIAAIEPIKSDAVFVADSVGCLDGQRPSSRFVLAISVRFQIDACGKFPLIDAESLAGMA
jgi:hypothetical protein